MSILEELYYGNINPNESGKINMKLTELICRHEEALEKSLNKTQKEVFEKFKDCESEMYGKYCRDLFVDGFVLGARIMIDVMKSNPVFGAQDEV